MCASWLLTEIRADSKKSRLIIIIIIMFKKGGGGGVARRVACSLNLEVNLVNPSLLRTSQVPSSYKGLPIRLSGKRRQYLDETM
jgi:pyruvate-formate lyase